MTVRGHRLLVVLAAALVGSLLAPTQAGAVEQRYQVRGLASVSFVGHGYGHGRGMSQWGAYGAATAGLGYASILSFYYPGTTVSTVTDPTMRVLISADNDNATKVFPVSGLSICSSTGAHTTLSASSTVQSWRIVRSGSVLQLQYFRSGAYHATSVSLPGSYATFTRSSTCARYGSLGMTLQLPSGAVVGIRAGVRAVLDGTAVRTVGVMTMTSYLASVVPSEMPSGWATEALKAQSVAARSYAERYRQLYGGAGHAWDICDTTACQVFHGETAEAASTTSAVAATAARVLTYGGALALTEFSASNGGWTTAGSSSTPYLVAKADPYDGVVASYGASWPNPHTWTATVSAATLQSRFPTIGTLVRLDVDTRDGHGDFGGRIVTVTVQGTAGSVTTTGSGFASAAGLKSIWWAQRFVAPNSDLTNDGRADLVLRPTGSGSIEIRPTTGTAVGAGNLHGSGWQQMDRVLVAGDLTGDFVADIVARNKDTGALFVYPGDGAGWVTSGRTLLADASAYSLFAAPGDFSGDGQADLLAVNAGTGQLVLFKGNGAGALAAPVAIGNGWSVMDTLLGVGDVNGDGYADLAARVASNGELRLYFGNGRGGFLSQTTMPVSYSALARLAAPGDVTGDGRPDLVGIAASNGYLYRYASTGSGYATGAILDSSVDWRNYDLIS